MAEPLDPGGNFLFTANAIASAADQNYQGAMVFRTLFGLFCARLFTNPVEVTGPLDGFFGEDCLVEHVSAMNVRVKPGFGLQVVTPADNYSPSFQPVVVESNTTQAISTADATHPRIDVIAIKASTTDTESASRNTYGGGSSMVNTVRKPSALISYTAGTPAASPVAPSTPAGYIKIAEVTVGAGATTVSGQIRDCRPLLRFDPAMVLAEPPAEYHTNFVPGSGNELLVSVAGTGSIKVTVQDGEAVINGYRHKYTPAVLTLSAGHASLPRIDLICADDEGEVIVLAGTPNSPAVGGIATPGAGEMILAYVLVPATVVNGSGCTATDYRVREPVGTAQIRDDAVTEDKIIDGAVTTAKIDDEAVTTPKVFAGLRPVIPVITYTGATSTSTVTVTMRDSEGDVVAAQTEFELVLLNQDNDESPGDVRTSFAAPAAGTIVQTYASTVNPTRLFCKTNSSGVFTFTLTNNQAATSYAIVIAKAMPGPGDGIGMQGWKEVVRTS